MRFLLRCLIGCGCATPALAVAQESPYVELLQRSIKALSAEEIAGYLSGDGMGFALAGELNGYPGPRHVLERADDLDLSDDQRMQTLTIFERMQTIARSLGEQIVDQEAALDSAFRAERIASQFLRAAVQEVARLNGELRATHLEAHLLTKSLLSADQVERYQRLRGYRVHPGDHQH